MAAGEPGFEIDSGKLKVGDGHTPWTLLEYFAKEDAVRDSIAREKSTSSTINSSALGMLHAALSRADQERVTVILVGSSTLVGGGASTYSKSMAHGLTRILQESYPRRNGAPSAGRVTLATQLAGPSTIPGVTVVNAASNGTTSETYITPQTRNRMTSMASRARIVVHCVGSNDFAANVPAETYMATMMSQISALDDGIDVSHVHVLVHAQHRSNVSVRGTPWASYGQALREIAEQDPSSRIFVDASGAFAHAGVPGADPFSLLADGIHPSDAGHILLANTVADSLRLRQSVSLAGAWNRYPFTSDSFSNRANDVVGSTSDATLGGSPRIWGGTPGSWTSASGKLVNAGSSTSIVGLSMSTPDYELSTRIAVLPSMNPLNVEIRRQSLSASATPDCVRVSVTPNGALLLYKRVEGALTLLSPTIDGIVEGDRISLGAKGSDVVLHRNGEVVHSVSLGLDVAGAGAGAFSAGAPTGAGAIDNIVIAALT
jgi:lysophospholipase L1-like esterase